MCRIVVRCGLAALCLGAVMGRGPLAQSGPGIPRLVYEPGELFQIVATLGTGNHGHSFMHDGYLAVLQTSNGVRFYDFSNPYEPVFVKSIGGAGMDLSEPHTVAQTTAWGGQHVVVMRGPGGLGGTGIAIWDWTDIFNPRLERSYDLPGVPGGYASGTFWMFVQAPYVYCPVGSLGLIILDASDPANPVVAKQISKSQLGGFNTVVGFAVGNLLVLTNSDSGSGFSRFDISDPLDPVLLDTIPGPIIPYGAQVNGDRLIVPAVSGCAACSGGGNGAFHIHDLRQQGFPIVGERTLPSRGGSAVLQDGFVHVAASTFYQKIDVSDLANFTVAGSTRMPYSGGDFDWVTPIGNLAVLGDDQGFGTQIVPHDRLPDNTGPEVTMVVPADGATNQALTTRVGITMTDMVEMLSVDSTTFTVRPVGGTPLSGRYSSQFGIVNFVPDEPLRANTTYEVDVSAGGMRDWAGNPVQVAFGSRFSTGDAVTAIVANAQRNGPVQPGQAVQFDVSSVAGPGPYRYSWDFGDGSPRTPLSTSSRATHTYARPGHYTALVTVTNGTVTGTDSFVQTVHHPVTPLSPSRSSTIVLDEPNNRAWCVNADNDTVTAIHTGSLEKLLEVPVGAHPRTLAVAPDGSIWVVCQDDATVRVLDPSTGAGLATIALPYASAPYGIAMSPAGDAAYVTLRARGEVAELDVAARSVVATTPVGAEPKGISLAADGERSFVTRVISESTMPGDGARGDASPQEVFLGERGDDGARLPQAEVYELSAARFERIRTIGLALDPGPDTEATGRGLPNYLSSLTITPDGRRLWVPSKKDNIQRGQFLSGELLTFENTVRTIASQIDLTSDAEDLAARIDFNDRDMAFAIAFSPLGDYAFHAIQGSNAVDVRDAYSGDLVAVVDGTGLAPQGLAVTSDGSMLFVHNFMSRSITAYDVSGVTSSTNFAMPLRAEIRTVADDALRAEVLRGKQIFYDATDPRMNEDGYLSCATCHLDGGHDGRTWDFTERGEGLRNTISLIGKAGTGHGNVHWTANFDEIQDFENDIRNAFRGDGFMSDGAFATTMNPLGHPKRGLSPELDALSAYVSSLTTFGLSPHRDPDGTLTAEAVAGKVLFEQLNCAQCHSGAAFTDSASGALHDVGTIRASSGKAMEQPITGFDTPTLRGLWATAPYLHDGSAATLMDVLTTKNRSGRHGATATLTESQLRSLVAYLLQIDDLEPGP